jgi:hypothetical protein
MKKHPRWKAALPAMPPLVTALLAAALLFVIPPLFAETRTEEEIDTGRFGAEDTVPETAWKEGLNTEWLYMGFRLGPSMRMYTPSDDTPYTGGDTHAAALELGIQANLQILPFLSIQGEVLFTWDNASVWDYRRGTNNELRYTHDYTAFFLQFPLMVRLDFYPGKQGRVRLSPFAGMYFLAPLGELTVSNSLTNVEASVRYKSSIPLGLLGGVAGAWKVGPGAIIADLRYAADLGSLRGRDIGIREFRRSMVSLTVGYELGFFSKKREE